MTKALFSFVEDHTAYIGVGSNLGDKRQNCLLAVDLLNEMQGVTVERRSSLYRSAPIGVADQDWYVNAVIRVKTSLSPRELLAAMHLIEMQLLRQREVHWGPRTIDLDLLFYDDQVIEEEGLRVPHPEIHNRSFVLMPLSEIAPRLLHPQLQKSPSALLKAMKDKTECVPLPGEGS